MFKAGVDPSYLNAGHMKPRRGFTLVAGKEKLGVDKTGMNGRIVTSFPSTP